VIVLALPQGVSYLPRNVWDCQTQTFANIGQGWIFWTWKAPNGSILKIPSIGRVETEESAWDLLASL
jgi:hypothetical protein